MISSKHLKSNNFKTSKLNNITKEELLETYNLHLYKSVTELIKEYNKIVHMEIYIGIHKKTKEKYYIKYLFLNENTYYISKIIKID
jgi:hypothetical protein